MSDGGLIYLNALTKWADLKRLVGEGEAEGLHVECKTCTVPRLTKDQKIKLARAVSGFSNTAGGVVMWGMSTTRHAHSGQDVMTQIEPVGACSRFLRDVENTIPGLTTPPVTQCQHRIIRRRRGDSRGVLLTYIPRTPGKPVQSNKDHTFHMRSEGGFVPLPYAMVDAMFAASEMPDIQVPITEELVERAEDGVWTIPFAVWNESPAAADDVKVSITVLNKSACASIESVDLQDASSVNPGQCLFWAEASGVVHRGISTLIGSLKVGMAGQKWPKRALKLRIEAYARKMVARGWDVTIQLLKSGKFKVTTSPVKKFY